jgi:hypothetical protein
MKEEWKPIPESDGKYLVSNFGRVKPIRTNQTPLKPYLGKDNYLRVKIYGKNKTYRRTVHRLVALAFIPNPENKKTVNHKDGVRTNNVITNLEWATHSENKLHSFRELGLKGSNFGKFGADNPKSKGVLQFTKDGKFVREYGGQAEAARIIGGSQGQISDACTGRAHTAYGFIWKFK